MVLKTDADACRFIDQRESRATASRLFRFYGRHLLNLRWIKPQNSTDRSQDKYIGYMVHIFKQDRWGIMLKDKNILLIISFSTSHVGKGSPNQKYKYHIFVPVSKKPV